MEVEFHEKISEYLSLKQNRNFEAPSSSVNIPNSLHDVPNVSDNPSETPSNISSDIPSEVISNDNEWMEPKY